MMFQQGDIVRFKKLRGPRMIVISVISQGTPMQQPNGVVLAAPTPMYGLAWFDRNDNLQERQSIHEMWLEKVEETDNTVGAVVPLRSFNTETSKAPDGPGTETT